MVKWTDWAGGWWPRVLDWLGSPPTILGPNSKDLLTPARMKRSGKKLKQKYVVFWLKSEDTALVGNPWTKNKEMLLQDQHRCTSQVTTNKIQNNLLVKLLYLGLRLYRQLVGSENPTRIPPPSTNPLTHPNRSVTAPMIKQKEMTRKEWKSRREGPMSKNLARRLRVTVGESPL